MILALANIGRKPKWNKNKIVTELQRLKLDGEPINYSSLRVRHHTLLSAIYYHFGSLSEAVVATGFDPEKQRWPKFGTTKGVRTTRTIWSKEKIISEFQAIKLSGEPINHLALRKNHYQLICAAKNYFGSYKAAMEAAGFNPDQERLKSGPAKGSSQRKWDKDKVITELQGLKTNGESISIGLLRKNHSSLLYAMKYHFGSWAEAVFAAGFDSEKEKSNFSSKEGKEQKGKKWNKEKIVGKLQKIKTNGEPLNSGYLLKYYRDLEAAIHNYFGPWAVAITTAGFDPEKERKRFSQSRRESKGSRNRLSYSRWNKDKIIAELQRLKLNGEHINYNYLKKNHRGLFNAIKHYFGSLSEAVAAAGFDSKKEKQWSKKWSKEKVISELQTLQSSGEQINYSYLKQNNPNLISAMERYFGSWTKAIIAAGLHPEKERIQIPKFLPKHKLKKHPKSPPEEYERFLISQGRLEILFPAIKKLRKTMKRKPTDNEIACYLGKSEKEIAFWQSFKDKLLLSYIPVADELAKYFYYHMVLRRRLMPNNIHSKKEIISIGYLVLVRVAETFDWGNELGSFSSYFQTAFDRELYHKFLSKEMKYPKISLDGTTGSYKNGDPILLYETLADLEWLKETSSDPIQLAHIKKALGQLSENLRKILLWDFGIENQDITPEDFANSLGIPVHDLKSLAENASRKLSDLISRTPVKAP